MNRAHFRLAPNYGPAPRKRLALADEAAAVPSKTTTIAATTVRESSTPGSRLYTLRQFAAAEPAFPLSRLRALRFNSQARITSKGVFSGNGFSTAFLKVGKSVYIDSVEFWNCVGRENGRDLESGASK